MALLEVTEVRAWLDESNERLEIYGRGFPVGREGELELSGRLGGAQGGRWISRTLSATAVSFDEAEALLRSEDWAGLSAPARFEGRVELRFAGLDGIWVSGALDEVVFELEADSPAPTGDEVARGGEVSSSLVRVSGGTTLTSTGPVGARLPQDSEVGGSHRGAAVGQGAPGSAATGASTPASSLPGSAGAPGSAESGAAAGGSSDAISVDFGALRTWVALISPVLLAVWFLGPWRSPVSWLQGLHARFSLARVSMFCSAPGSVGSRLGAVWPWGAVAVFGVGVVAVPGLSLGALFALYAVTLVVRHGGAGAEGRAAFPGRSLGGWFGVLSLALACVAVWSGTGSLSAIAVDQGGLPWGFNLFARPVSMLAACLVLAASVELHPQVAPDRARACADGVARALLALMVATLFLGGALEGGWVAEGSRALRIAVSCALLAGKACLVLCAMAVWRALAARRPLRVAMRGAALLVVGASGWLWLQPAREVEERIGAVVLMTLVLAGVIACALHGFSLRARRASPPALG